MENDVKRTYLHEALASAYPDLALYFRPPKDMFITRPCIIYEPKAQKPKYASGLYSLGAEYQLTILTDLPGFSGDFSLLYQIPRVTVLSTTAFVEDDIVHDVFNIVFA